MVLKIAARVAVLLAATLTIAACEEEIFSSEVDFPSDKRERAQHCVLVLRYDINHTAEEYSYNRNAAAVAIRESRDALTKAWEDAREDVLASDQNVRGWFAYLHRTFDTDKDGRIESETELKELDRHVRLCQDAYR